MTTNTTYTVGSDSHQVLSSNGLFRRRDLWILSATTFIAAVLSKAGSLLPGMSPDDYLFTTLNSVRDETYHLIAQGRGLNALLLVAADSLKTNFTGASGFTFFLATAMISLAIATSITLIKSEHNNRIHHYVAAAFAATHTYLTSYFIFRMSLLNHALIYASLSAALWLIANHRTLWRQTACILLLAACSHISQIILILFAIGAGGWSLAKYCHERKQGVSNLHAIGGIVSFTIVLSLATALYVLSSTVMRAVLHVTATPDYSPHLHGGVLGTLRTASKLSYDVMFTDESIAPYWLKISVALILSTAIVYCLIQNRTKGVLCLGLLICGLLVTVAPLALTWGGLVPRTFSPIGICIALVFCIACSEAKPRPLCFLSGAMFIPIASFCFIGSSLFYQQFMLTQWDQRTAVAIFDRITQKAPESTLIRIVASWPFHEQPLSYNGPGINESAFFYSWAYPGLFAVATGEKLNVTAGEQSQCSGMPSWPNPGSMRELDDGSILVCMVK